MFKPKCELKVGDTIVLAKIDAHAIDISNMSAFVTQWKEMIGVPLIVSGFNEANKPIVKWIAKNGTHYRFSLSRKVVAKLC